MLHLVLLTLCAGEPGKVDKPPRYLAEALATSDIFTVTLYAKSGKPVREWTIQRDSDAHQRLQTWLGSLRRKGFTLTTWIPEVRIASDRLIAQFSGERLFLTVLDDNGKPSLQYKYAYDEEATEVREWLLAELATQGRALE